MTGSCGVTEISAYPLLAGHAQGVTLVLEEPLSLWGGIDPESGVIVGRHPQAGTSVAGRVLVMREARGSSSSATVLAEAIRLGSAPAAIVMEVPDDVITAGAIVAEELYGKTCPVIRVDSIAGLRSGILATVDDGTIRVGGGSGWSHQ